VYIVHVSSADGAEMVAKIKEENRYIFAETTSPYLSVTSAQYGDTTGLMVPPLRTERDVNGLWDAVKSGVIDTIGTDNVTLTLREKGDPHNVWNAFPGYPALETHLPALLTEGCVKRGLDIERLVCLLRSGRPNCSACIRKKERSCPTAMRMSQWDLQALKTVRAAALHSRSDFSIHEGRGFTGWPTLTIKNGIVVVRDGEPTGRKAATRVITRRSGRY
jgi:dihydropyrimidinase